MWGAGGATDVVSRAVTPHAEQALGKKIVLVNKPGGTGAISTNFVNQRARRRLHAALRRREPATAPGAGPRRLRLREVLSRSTCSAAASRVIVVKTDAPWNTFKEFVEDAKTRPASSRWARPVPAACRTRWARCCNSVTKFQVISVPFDGEGPGLTALMGGHVDMMPVGAGAAAENIKAGRVKALAVIDTDAMPIAGPAIPPITKDYPEFAQVPALGAVLRRVRQARHAGRRQGDAGQGVQDRRRQRAVQGADERARQRA